MTDPTTALQRLGLSKYESEVFVALQQIDAGTASDVATVADVPRSQVYGAAEDLETRGLLDVQHGSPKRYRAVSLEEAREELRQDFEREYERAFEALEELEMEFSGREERQEEIWTVTGRETIDARVDAFLDQAESTVRFGAEPELFDDALAAKLEDVAEGASVLVVVSDESVAETFTDTSVEALVVPDAYDNEGWPAGRFLVVDDQTLLLSVVGADGEESAFWCADTDFASLLIRLLAGHLDQFADVDFARP